jgi:hypothetical protein
MFTKINLFGDRMDIGVLLGHRFAVVWTNEHWSVI